MMKNANAKVLSRILQNQTKINHSQGGAGFMDIFDDAGGLLGMDLDTISGEDLFAFRIEKMPYLCGLRRFANAYVNRYYTRR